MGGLVIFTIICLIVYIGMKNKSNHKYLRNKKKSKRDQETNAKNYNLNTNFESFDDYLEKLQAHTEEIIKNNFSGKAAEAIHKAKAAIKEKQFDTAWRLYLDAKTYYLKHSNQTGSSNRETLGLQGFVHEKMANILRLEGRHKDALTHIIYWIATDNRILKKHDKKLTSYLKRVGYDHIPIPEAKIFIEEVRRSYDFRMIQNKVNQWENREPSSNSD